MSALTLQTLRSIVLYIKALGMTGPDRQMFAGGFNGTEKKEKKTQI